jgi:surface protein
MFSGCSGLTSLDISGWNTTSVWDLQNMFSGCTGLTSLDLSNWNTANVWSLEYMFSDCSSLTSLDISGWNTANVMYMNNLFANCLSLTTIYAGEGWSTELVYGEWSEGMFTGCTALVGGMGTVFDENHTNKAYARIDGGPDNPGYFTAKSTTKRGDVNGDNIVNISDVTALIDYLLRGDTSSINLDNADANQDKNISISDVTVLINYLLREHW